MLLKNLPDILTNTAETNSTKGIYFVGNKFLSYKELLTNASGLAVNLFKRATQNDKIIIAVSNNFERVNLLWASFICGIVPTIVQNPIIRNENTLQIAKLLSIFQTLEKPLVIVSEHDYALYSDNNIIGNYIVNFNDLNNYNCNDIILHEQPELAYIQFSSGTTGKAKGVKLTRENIISNLEAIKKGIKVTSNDISFNWMPLYHDMGLIGFHLSSVYNGIDQYLMETEEFVRKPLSLLDFINDKKITITGCPNFAQNLILKHLARKKDYSWDLSSLRVMLNGAEPISPEIVTKFVNSLSKSGFKSTAMFPVYGLAEATLAATFPPLNSVPVITSFDSNKLFGNKRAVESDTSLSKKYISVGKPVADCNIRIVDENFNEVEIGTTGYIQLEGKNVTSGYYGNEESNTCLFSDGWLNTGDIGFMYNGLLYIIGRNKDTIIINGKNYCSTDLEETAKKTLNDNTLRLYIIPTDNNKGGDKVILFIAGLNKEKAVNIFFRLKKYFSRYAEFLIEELIVIKSSGIPRTSSGKVMRYKLRENYELGKYDEIIADTKTKIKEIEHENLKNKVQPVSPTEKILHKVWYTQLLMQPEEIGVHDSFYGLGGASIDVVDIILELKQSYKIKINSHDFYSHNTIKELAVYIDKNSLYQSTVNSSRKKFRG